MGCGKEPAVVRCVQQIAVLELQLLETGDVPAPLLQQAAQESAAQREAEQAKQEVSNERIGNVLLTFLRSWTRRATRILVPS